MSWPREGRVSVFIICIWSCNCWYHTQCINVRATTATQMRDQRQANILRHIESLTAYHRDCFILLKLCGKFLVCKVYRTFRQLILLPSSGEFAVLPNLKTLWARIVHVCACARLCRLLITSVLSLRSAFVFSAEFRKWNIKNRKPISSSSSNLFTLDTVSGSPYLIKILRRQIRPFFSLRVRCYNYNVHNNISLPYQVVLYV
jgi:hypothetical protein